MISPRAAHGDGLFVTVPKLLTRAAASALASVVVLTSFGAPAEAITTDRVGEFNASGFLFKDSVELTAIEDPEVAGITVYVSDFKRSIMDKLAKDFFSEPSQASISCSITGPVNLTAEQAAALGGTEGKELFAESKGFNIFKNKTLRIRRVYDAKRNTIIYIGYSTRLSTAADDGAVSSGRYRTSICAVTLPTQ